MEAFEEFRGVFVDFLMVKGGVQQVGALFELLIEKFGVQEILRFSGFC